MKILLINPPITKIVDPSLPEIILSGEDPMPPLGIMYLAGYLEKHTNHEVKIIDCQIDKINQNQLHEKINKEKPDAVGITTMTFTLLDVLKTVKTVKSVNENIKVILGGPHVHIYPDETIGLPGVDYLVIGEGELALAGLLDNFDDYTNLKNIKGLVFKDKNGDLIHTGHNKLIQDLDSLPFPARYLTPYKKYESSLSKNFPVTTMFTSRGCPYHCLFCDRPHLGNKFRARSAKNVVKEMKECEQMGIREIFIYDDTFGIDRQRVLDICSLIKKSGLRISWDIRTRVNTVDEEVLSALKNTGCERIHFGVEAGTDHILKILRKGITIEMAQKAFTLARKAGIQTLGYFMIGAPEETKEEILKTIKIAKKLNPDFAHFSITTPYPATDLYALGLKNKTLPKDYWKEFAENPTEAFVPMIWEEKLSKKELVALLKKAYRSFYFRPGYILKQLLSVSSTKELINKISAGLKIFKI